MGVTKKAPADSAGASASPDDPARYFVSMLTGWLIQTTTG